MSKVLIVADRTKQCCATARGLELAAKLGCDAEVVAFAQVSLEDLNVDTAERKRLREYLLADREATERERIDRFSEPGQTVSLKVVWEKDIVSWINKRCAGKDYWGVVKTSSNTGTLSRTSSDWLLLQECPVPVLMVAEKQWRRVSPVLATLDLSSRSASKRALNDKVLGVAVALAKALDVELKVITAIEIPTLLADLDLVDPLAYEKQARAAMMPAIKKLSARYALEESVFKSKCGPIDKVITSRAAKERAQIVVMGTVGRGGVKRLLLGSTAEKVLRQLKTDVLAVKP